MGLIEALLAERFGQQISGFRDVVNDLDGAVAGAERAEHVEEIGFGQRLQGFEDFDVCHFRLSDLV